MGSYYTLAYCLVCSELYQERHYYEGGCLRPLLNIFALARSTQWEACILLLPEFFLPLILLLSPLFFCKTCVKHILITTGPIFVIQKRILSLCDHWCALFGQPHESSLAIGVCWLGNFTIGSKQEPTKRSQMPSNFRRNIPMRLLSWFSWFKSCMKAIWP